MQQPLNWHHWDQFRANCISNLKKPKKLEKLIEDRGIRERDMWAEICQEGRL